jgi:putative DNA primase/helicase
MSFRVTDKGVLYESGNGDKKKSTWICARLDVVAETRNDIGKEWGKQLSWKDPDGRPHRWAMPMALLGRPGDPVIAELLSGGLRIDPSSKQLVCMYIQSTNSDRKMLCTNRTGWCGQSYVLPDTTIEASGGEEVIYQSANEHNQYYKVSGTGDDWRAKVGRYCSGNSRLILATSCVLAGPVLRLLGEESGGVHIFGGTSTGKTTAGVVSGSVMGGGTSNGCVETWRATANGLEGRARERNDSCLILDELGQVAAQEVGDVIYMLANGQGKGRAPIDGTSIERVNWLTSVVSTGEVTIEQHAASADRKIHGGVGVRILDIPADAGAGKGAFENIHGATDPGAFARMLKENATTTYGAVFREWVTCLLECLDGCKDILRERAQNFFDAHCPGNAASEVQRAVRRFAVVAAAGDLATIFGVTGWADGEASWACKRCVNDWIAQRGGTGAFDDEKVLSQIRIFLKQHDARFQRFALGDIPREMPPNHRGNAGFYKNNSYFIDPDVFKKEVCTGFDPKQVCRILRMHKYLDAAPSRFEKQLRVHGKKPAWFYAVKESILYSGDDADDNPEEIVATSTAVTSVTINDVLSRIE